MYSCFSKFVSSSLLLFAATLSFAGRASAGASEDHGEFNNPVLFADYSDPDVIRVGPDYYLIASSFHFSPGIPILHSKDLVHWSISGHVLNKLLFGPSYDMEGGNRYGGGVWAPAVRFHNGLFYVYFPTPDEGIFVSTAPKMTGPWSAPKSILEGRGWEDPCPFWDSDGNAYLVHSRLGGGPLILHRMTADGMSLLDDGKVIVEDSQNLPTLEGPKLYKRNGYYYIFAPFGGVGEGSQAVLRSKNIQGPYEHRVVLAAGTTGVNGPHQGAYVETPDGEGWFLHFHSQGAHGRIVYLEPVRWENGWPLVGDVTRGETTGQPVARYKVPMVVSARNRVTPQTSDEFTASVLTPQWEWNHNPIDDHWSLTQHRGFLRLIPAYAEDLAHARNTLTEMMQDESMQFTAKVDVEHMQDGDCAGISMFDSQTDGIALVQKEGIRTLSVFDHSGSQSGQLLYRGQLQLSIRLDKETVTYFYSLDDGRSFQQLGKGFQAVSSWWKGARPALFAFTTEPKSAGKGYIDFDWVHYQALPNGNPAVIERAKQGSRLTR